MREIHLCLLDKETVVSRIAFAKIRQCPRDSPNTKAISVVLGCSLEAKGKSLLKTSDT